jgi:hypothetical protein
METSNHSLIYSTSRISVCQMLWIKKIILAKPCTYLSTIVPIQTKCIRKRLTIFAGFFSIVSEG